jgi:RNA polymerase sigma-70 factor, ECF subfamily
MKHPGLVWGNQSSEAAPATATIGAQSTDAILAQRLKQRDPQALSAIYDKYGRLAFTVILRTVREVTVAEDLVQETFLRVWNRATSFDPQRGSLGTWIVQVARNQAIDYVRSVDARMSAAAVDLDVTEERAARFALEDESLSLDRRRRIQEAIRKLTPTQREVIQLAYFEGLSQTEMADRLERPLGTVKSWVRAALNVLREELA